MYYRIRITKGCPALGIDKGAIGKISPKAITNVGVEAGFFRTQFGSRLLWFTGNRVHAPALRAGQSIRLSDGNPSRVVVAEVTDVYDDAAPPAVTAGM